MVPGRTASELAVLVVFCVLTIFLFPAVQGPYPAVHGPVTALQAVRAAARVRNAIMAFALRASRIPVLSWLVLLLCIGASVPECRPFGLAECDSILRC